MENHQPPAHSLTCSCGFFTSLTDYMLVHLRQGNPECVWTDGQRALVQARMRTIDAIMRAAQETMQLAASELDNLRAVFQHKPEDPRRKVRRCFKCGKKTSNKFGERYQCEEHVAKGDPAM